MKKADLSGNWKEGNNLVQVNLPVMYFEEDSVQIAYIPVLDLSGYGKDHDEAFKSLEIVLEEYLSYTIRKNTLIQDLQAHGWTIKKKTKPYVAPEFTDLIAKNEYLHNIVNTRPYSIERIDVEMPQYI